MATKKITAPVKYKACVITPAPKGYDVFDGAGHWFNVPDQRQAKWWASLATRIQDRFAESMVRPLPTVIEDHTPKPPAK